LLSQSIYIIIGVFAQSLFGWNIPVMENRQEVNPAFSISPLLLNKEEFQVLHIPANIFTAKTVA